MKKEDKKSLNDGCLLPCFSCNLALWRGFLCRKRRKNARSRPIIALDFPSFDDVKSFLALFPADEKLYVKIGMELYYAAGPEIVRYVKSLGHSVFLDLKLHDIPNTVKSAMRVLSILVSI